MKLINWAITLLIFSVTLQSAASPIPAMKYVSNVDDEHSFDVLKSNNAWKNLDKELHGSPFLLVAYMETQETNGGSAAVATSALFSAATLGIIPIVNNNDIVLTFRIRLNNSTVTEHIYTHNVTDANSIWAGPNRELNKETKEWLKKSTEKFVSDISTDDQLAEVLKEYEFYFGNS
ncbi:hypothetical protein ACFSJY_05045 [Thalassotalea euphylliae]|uniref:hypothetical protein n=1 Tax=Thalassotalea euphylliae TaxID=1655234 RepID=UPI00362E86B2